MHSKKKLNTFARPWMPKIICDYCVLCRRRYDVIECHTFLLELRFEELFVVPMLLEIGTHIKKFNI